MAPQLITIFWTEVENTLVSRFKFGRTDARTAVSSFRNEFENAEVGEAIFNRGTDQIAQRIADSALVR